jgi:dolichol-phosphate mannosyltransferase
LPIQDATGGFRAYSARALKEVDLAKVRSQGYCFQIDMLRRAHHAGQTITEVPITFVERTQGNSKMSLWIVLEAMANVTVWGIKRPFTRRKTRAVSAHRPGKGLADTAESR